MSNRRQFLRLIGITGAAAWAPVLLGAATEPLPVLTDPVPDPMHPRYGVYTIQHFIKGMMFWVKCDCGAEQEIHADTLLSPDALSCDHVRHRGFFCIPSNAGVCQNCGNYRRWFFNARGVRIYRCGWCEDGDIKNFLAYKYDNTSSIQFRANMERQVGDPACIANLKRLDACISALLDPTKRAIPSASEHGTTAGEEIQ